METYRIIAKSNPTEPVVAEFTTFPKCAKWLLESAAAFGTEFEVWFVKTYKRKPNIVELETTFSLG